MTPFSLRAATPDDTPAILTMNDAVVELTSPMDEARLADIVAFGASVQLAWHADQAAGFLNQRPDDNGHNQAGQHSHHLIVDLHLGHHPFTSLNPQATQTRWLAGFPLGGAHPPQGTRQIGNLVNPVLWRNMECSPRIATANCLQRTVTAGILQLWCVNARKG